MTTPLFTWLDWMHPSWRDMVIDYLVDHKEERQTFLRKCGLQGLLLALSTGGGKKGLRKFPLLIEPEDWAICGDSISILIKNNSVLELRSLLSTILDLVQIDHTSAAYKQPAKPPISDVARRALDGCLERWGGQGWAIQPVDLLSYYKISEFLSPLPPSPDLRETWQRHLEAACAEMKTFDENDSEILVSDISDWLQLCAIIQNFEPRFARQVGLPQSYEAEVKEFLPSLDSRASWAPDFTTVDECDDEGDQQRIIQDLAAEIVAAFPNLCDEATEIANNAEDTEQKVEAQKSRLEQIPDEDVRDYMSEDEDIPASGLKQTAGENQERARTVFLTAPPKASLSVDELFQDL